MGYNKQNFIKGQILKADHLNHMEDGISELNNTVVKSVNGVFPNENGDIVSDKAFREDMSVFGGRVMARKTAQEIADACIQTKTAPVFACIFDNNTNMRYISTKIDSRFVGTMGVDGHFARVLHFDDDKVPPIIVDGVNNTITVDPDWSAVKPNQYLTTDANGNKIWEDKICWSTIEKHYYLQDKIASGMFVSLGTIITSALESGTTLNVECDGELFNCTLTECSDLGMCIGNASILGQGENTGEKFFVFGLVPGAAAMLCFNDSEEHTISIYGNVDVVHKKIPSMYIAGGISMGTGLCSDVMNGQSPNNASGEYSHAENFGIASGRCSHAEGFSAEAQAEGSHAEGRCTVAKGESSHAEGIYTIANGAAQHVEGMFNIEDADEKYISVVGNGMNVNNRSNAYTLDWDGNAWFAGTIEGTGIIIKSSTEGSEKKFKISVDDSGNITAKEVTV